MLRLGETKKDEQHRINISGQHVMCYSGVKTNEGIKEGVGLTQELNCRVTINEPVCPRIIHMNLNFRI